MDSGAVDSAVIGLLQNDATLRAMLPDGVFFDAAPQGSKRFAIVSIVDHEDEYMFEGGTAFERFEYFIKAVIFSTSASDARKACTQIAALLQNADTRLAPVGYRVVRCQRLMYRRYSENDVDPTQKWQHEGGQYDSPSCRPSNPTTRGAPMNRMYGSKGSIKMDPTGAGGLTAEALASMNAWTLNMAREKADVTAFGDPNKVYVQGLPDIKGTLGGWYDSDDLAIFDAALGDIAVALELIPSTLQPTFLWKGLAWLDASIDVKATGAISLGGNFVAAAGWTREPAGAMRSPLGGGGGQVGGVPVGDARRAA